MSQFDFAPQQTVVYNDSCICRIEEIVRRCFDGEHSLDYYKLCPVRGEHSSYYVPVAQAGERLRNLMTEAEVLEIIDSLEARVLSLSDDSRERKEAVGRILKGGDYGEILCMLHALRTVQAGCKSSGKRVSVSDENAIRSGEERVFPEFAMALQISEDEVDSFIRTRLGEAV